MYVQRSSLVVIRFVDRMEERLMSLMVALIRHTRLAGIATIVALVTGATPVSAQEFSSWGAPENLGLVVNSASTDGCPSIAKSELTLFFASNRPGGYGGLDIYVTQRDSRYDPWETPRNAGPTINGSGNELCPTLAINGHHLFFVSDRPGGCGAQDLYVAWRRDKRNDFRWETTENLGCVVNSPSNDFTPSLFEDEATSETIVYFSSNRPGGPGGTDIYWSMLESSGTFGPANLDWALSTAADDQRPNVRKDGLEIFFDSNRPSSLSGSADLWTSTRTSTTDPWAPPTNITPLNSAATEGRPSLSFDGQMLYFMSSRIGGYGGIDLYRATRTKDGADER
jgi:Tol biopolymer transport system component